MLVEQNVVAEKNEMYWTEYKKNIFFYEVGKKHGALFKNRFYDF